ncbi:MAG: hypothetical protein IJX78_04565 [Bacilli bacterium]|nr:hypothetical protein [Bacilli bacterium]
MKIKKGLFSILLLWFILILTSCGSPLDTTIDEINQRYLDQNPMVESDVLTRFKSPINVRRTSETTHISLWVPNYDTLDEVKQDIENGKEVVGVFVYFEETTRKFQRLNEETLEMEWYEKVVIDAVHAEKKAVSLKDLK